MAEKKTEVVEGYLTCPVCLETFRDPVSLSCNHSFCLICLKEFWDLTKNKNCPICKRKSSKGSPLVNFALKELAESFAGSLKVGSSETEKGEQKVEVVCSKHPEEPKLFCKDENRAVCLVCDFPHQREHTVVPVEEAVTEMKDELKSDLKSLQEKKKKYKQTQKTYKEIMEHLKNQVLWTESQIRAEFNKLQQFLKEEEESRLAALREEEKQKRRSVIREMKRIEEQMSSVSDSICAVEEELQKASAPFLISCKDTQSRARAQCSVSEPQLISGALIHVDKHLGNLSFRVWDKMRDKVHFSPVILDPNTANTWLHLSDDLTSVRHGDTYQQVPDNPERNTKYTTVHGSEGFTSGRHSWDVEVGDHPGWTLGLVKMSVDRKGEVFALPECGFWCLCHLSGKYTNGLGQTVTVQTSPQRIRVELDYDRGEVSFYNTEDKTQIYTHRDTFTEKLYPYFNVGPATDAKTIDIKICPRKISLFRER
ncbi:tripartite motif-containing protein 35-like [Sphaeramia orbicularis]|uniref:tripartite motif-containing protein 35-like n=1 Tax=Sphaeramia orbicularis TaxID=375764 RepID=UPI0011806002|nr:tripartite motif-containing protein 35-like [Sphaeramia orbicularis]